MTEPTSRGVHFPLEGDSRPTTATTRSVLADSVRAVDATLADRIEGTHDWRKGYVDLVHEVTAASAATPEVAAGIAADGLASLRRRMVVIDDAGETPVGEATLDAASDHFATETVTGTSDPVTELVVPVDGRDLSGDALLAELDRWLELGWVEPSFVEAVAAVVAHPEWLALPDQQILLIGAGAEMGPMEPLLSWGVDVHAIDLPRSRAWRYKKGLAATGAGRLSFPVSSDGDSGADIVHQPAEVLDWIRRERGDGPLTVAMHAYADSGAHVRVSTAADLLMTRLTDDQPGTSLAWLATPTDAFVVPADVVAAARQRWQSRGVLSRGSSGALRAAARGRLFAPAYADAAPSGGGIADVIVPQQGPNYAIAKRVQRWRGVEAEGNGQTVSFNVAPATWTRSVVKNPVLGAAYAGAHRFGVHVFAPETVRPLMAALLVRDLMSPHAPRAHPEELFSDAAAHGGLWRAGYEPKTALGVAAVAGLPSRIVARARRV